jgi:hypothetical protein
MDSNPFARSSFFTVFSSQQTSGFEDCKIVILWIGVKRYPLRWNSAVHLEDLETWRIDCLPTATFFSSADVRRGMMFSSLSHYLAFGSKVPGLLEIWELKERDPVDGELVRKAAFP